MSVDDLPLYNPRPRPVVRVHDFGRRADRKDAVRALVPDASDASDGGMVIPGCPRVLNLASPYLLLDADTGQPVAVVNEEELRAGWVRA